MTTTAVTGASPLPQQVTEYQTGFSPEIAPYGQALLGEAASYEIGRAHV